MPTFCEAGGGGVSRPPVSACAAPIDEGVQTSLLDDAREDDERRMAGARVLTPNDDRPDPNP